MYSNQKIKEAVSAGGVVAKKINGKIHVLLIRDKKYSDWVMAKGHVEEGETIEQAALREVSEEAGVNDVKIIKLLGTYKRYVKKADENKTIHYFLMVAGDKVDLNKDLSTEKDEIKWFPIDNIPDLFLEEQKDLIEKNKDKINLD